MVFLLNENPYSEPIAQNIGLGVREHHNSRIQSLLNPDPESDYSTCLKLTFLYLTKSKTKQIGCVESHIQYSKKEHTCYLN